MQSKIYRHKYFYFFCYIALVLIIYAQTFHFSFALDDDLIKEGIEGKIVQFSDIFDVFKHRYNRVDYRPISMLTFALEYFFVGSFNPEISHKINVFIFILILISLHYFIQLLFKGKYKIETFFIVCIFAVHPLVVEVVANIKSRDGLLSMLFGIWSLYFYLKSDYSNYKIKYLIYSWFLFTIGLFAKLDILGIILFIFGYSLVKFKKKDWIYGFVMIVFFLATYSFFRDSLIEYLLPLDSNIDSKLAVTTFTENPLAGLSGFVVSILTFLQVIYIYIGKILLPSKLCYYYGFNYYQLDASFSFKTILLLILFILIVVGTIYLSKRNRLLLISGIGFLSFIFFATGFFTTVAGIVADRYVFMALPWFIMLLVLFFLMFSPIDKLGSKIVLSSIILIYGSISFMRTKAWENLLTLIETDAPKLHQSYEGMRIASGIYFDNFELTKDTIYLDKAIQCAFNANQVYAENVLMNTQLGQFLYLKNDLIKSEQYLKKAYTVDSTNASLLEFLGDINYSKRDYQKAEYYYSKAYSHAEFKHQQALINNISTLYYEQGLKDKTLAYNFELIKKDSLNFAAYENIGYYYLAEKDTNKAKEYFNLASKQGMPIEGIPNFLK